MGDVGPKSKESQKATLNPKPGLESGSSYGVPSLDTVLSASAGCCRALLGFEAMGSYTVNLKPETLK